MAHADYHCCAICDNKLFYSSNASSKETLCLPCGVEMVKLGHPVKSVDELKEWVKKTPAEEVERVLLLLNFKECVYTGEIDELVEAKLGRKLVKQ